MPLAITKPTIGFMLAHEQFPVPQLVDLGVFAEQAGFDLFGHQRSPSTMASQRRARRCGMDHDERALATH